MNKLHIALITAVLLTGSAAAQTNMQSSGDIDTVILASTANYPDALVASGPAQSLGTPVLLTDQDQIPESTQDTLDELDPENVVVVGGPAVISEEVETELEAEYDTTRLWGTTQIGTSVEVADYFWTDSEKAVVAQYPQDEDRHELLAEVREEAGENPILVSDEGSLSADVLTKLEDLGVEEVEVYSTEAVEVEEDLSDIGVENTEIHEENEQRLEDQLQEETNIEGSSELVIVAAGNFKHTISVPSTPDSSSYIVSSEEDIDEAVNTAAEADSETTIRVVGQPDLAQDITDSIESETEKEVDHVSGQEAADQAAEAVSKAREKWENTQSEKFEEWKQQMNSNPQIEEKVNKALERVRNSINEETSEKAQSALEEAENALENGDYVEAKEKTSKAQSNIKMDSYAQMDEEEIREQVREERQDMREIAEEIRESSQEMAEELRNAESSEERREIIKEYREDKRDLIQEIREEAREMRDEMSGEIPEQASGEVDDVGSTYTNLETDGNEVTAEVEYTGPTGGYEVQKETNVNGDTVEFHFDFQSPDGPATQAITGYDSEAEETLEDGEYTAKIIVSADGETEKEVSHDFSVPSDQEFEEETENEEESNENEGSETEQEAEIEIESDGQMVRAEAEYSGETGGYGIDREVNVDGDEVNIVFNLETPEDPATTVITNYNPEVEEALESGEYRVNAKLRVDGEVQAEDSEAITIESDESTSSSVSTNLDVNSDGETVEVGMAFSADTEYELEKDIQRNGEDITATFDLTSSSSGSTSYDEQITEELESGSYNVEALVRVDGEIRQSTTQSAEIN